MAQKLPFLLGVRRAPDGFLQGAALTLFVNAVACVFALGVALVTAMGRLSRNPIAFALATFYASLFRGTPYLVDRRLGNRHLVSGGSASRGGGRGPRQL